MGFSCKFSLKPIQWILSSPETPRFRSSSSPLTANRHHLAWFFFAQVVLPWREISNHLGELAQLQPERDKGGPRLTWVTDWGLGRWRQKGVDGRWIMYSMYFNVFMWRKVYNYELNCHCIYLGKFHHDQTLFSRALEIMVNKGNHPKMTLIQVSEIWLKKQDLWYFEGSHDFQIAFGLSWERYSQTFADIRRFDFDLWYGLCRYYDDSCWVGRMGSCSYQTPPRNHGGCRG